MHIMRTVTLSDGTESTDVKVSVLSWVRISLADGHQADQMDFACAIYNYNQAATNYTK